MKVIFKDYVYFGDKKPNSPDKEAYAFNDDTFKSMIAERRYEDAANYAAQYHFTDPRVQQEHENDIRNLRRNGRILGSVYSKITNQEDLASVEFADKVFLNGGIEQLSMSDNQFTKDYTNAFIKAKENLASKPEGVSSGTRTEDDIAVKLSVTFQPEKQTFLGIDWLARDNEDNIDNFYVKTGFTQKELEAYGVEVANKDGKTTLTFGKDNPLANKIIYNLPNPIRNYGLGTTLTRKGVVVTGYNYTGDKVVVTDDVIPVKHLIQKALDTKERIFNESKLNTFVYSSTVGPALNDDLEQLMQARNSGQITDSEYNREYKRVAGWMDDVLNGLGSSNYEFYTNAYNDSPTDETLVPVDSKKRSDLMSLVSAAKNRIHLLSMMSNGQVGTLIVIDAKPNLKEEDDVNSGYTSRRRAIFVPGLFQEQAQAKINRNSSLSALQEINDMQTWGYDYKCADGTKITVDELGRIWGENKEISKDEAVRQINKDIIKRNYADGLKFKYLNNDDELIDFDGYERDARLIAIKAANELRPDVSLTDKEGKPYTIDDIFSMFANPTDDQLLHKESMSQLQYTQYDKILDIFDIYNYIMKGTSYYK